MLVLLPVLVAMTATNTGITFHLDRCSLLLTNYTSRRLVFLKLCFTCMALNRSGVGVVEKRGGYRKNKPKQRPTNILTKKPFASTTRDVYELYHNACTQKPLKKFHCAWKGQNICKQTRKMRASPLIVHNFCAIYQLSLVTFMLLERDLNREPIFQLYIQFYEMYPKVANESFKFAK